MLTCTDDHRYFLGDRELAGCTTTLKRLGLIDTSFYTDEGLVRGTEVHRRIRELLMGRTLTHADELRGYVHAAQKYLADSHLEVLHVELELYDEALGIAGTPDVIAVTTPGGGRFRYVIPDWKTGGVERWHGIQLAVYEHLARTRGLVEGLCDRLTVHLKDDGTYSTQPYKDRRDWKIAHAAITLDNWRNGGR